MSDANDDGHTDAPTATANPLVRQCWICYGEEAITAGQSPLASSTVLSGPAPNNSWICPCRCSGTTRWVHQRCLLNWLRTRQRHDRPSATNALSCPQCGSEYRFVQVSILPRAVVRAFEVIWLTRDRLLLYGALAGIGLASYMVCFSYGAATFVICVGATSAREFVLAYLQPILSVIRYGRSATNFQLTCAIVSKVFIGLPLIPFVVLSSQFPSLSWSYPLIPAILYHASPIIWSWPPPPKVTALLLPFGCVMYLATRRLVSRYFGTLLRKSFGSRSLSSMRASTVSTSSSEYAQMDIEIEVGDHGSESLSTTSSETDSEIVDDQRLRISIMSVTAALAFPAAAALTGLILFGRSDAASKSVVRFNRTVLGGLVFLALKDTGKTLYSLHSYFADQTRRVINYPGATMDSEEGKK